MKIGNIEVYLQAGNLYPYDRITELVVKETKPQETIEATYFIHPQIHVEINKIYTENNILYIQLKIKDTFKNYMYVNGEIYEDNDKNARLSNQT